MMYVGVFTEFGGTSDGVLEPAHESQLQHLFLRPLPVTTCGLLESHGRSIYTMEISKHYI